MTPLAGIASLPKDSFDAIVLGVANGPRHATVPPQDPPKIPFAAVAGSLRIFEGHLIDRDSCKVAARYIVWVLCPSTVRFVADTISSTPKSQESSYPVFWRTVLSSVCWMDERFLASRSMQLRLG
jgi:hypothetical protein